MSILLNLYYAWFKMGLFTFGGGYAMLPMIQREVIEKYHWASEDEIMTYYAIGQCTPGIIAVNTATFVGYKVKGIIGGIVATLGVVSPSIIIITIIASFLENIMDYQIVIHALNGIQVAVCLLMIVSIKKLFKSNIKNYFSLILFLLAFIVAYFTNISTVIIVVLAGVIGYVYMTIKGEQ